MEKWYVMRTVPGKEAKAAELMERTVDRNLWKQWRILKKQKLFRAKGHLFLNTEDMFPGYIFVETGHPEELQEELGKSREYPALLGNQGTGKHSVEVIPVEGKDLEFLKSVCGPELDKYENRITRKRLRKRYVLAQIDLFCRKEDILFGICMPGDEILKESQSKADP